MDITFLLPKLSKERALSQLCEDVLAFTTQVGKIASHHQKSEDFRAQNAAAFAIAMVEDLAATRMTKGQAKKLGEALRIRTGYAFEGKKGISAARQFSGESINNVQAFIDLARQIGASYHVHATITDIMEGGGMEPDNMAFAFFAIQRAEGFFAGHQEAHARHAALDYMDAFEQAVKRFQRTLSRYTPAKTEREEEVSEEDLEAAA